MDFHSEESLAPCTNNQSINNIYIYNIFRLFVFSHSAVTMPTRGAQSAAKLDLGHLLRIQHLKL